MMMRANGAKIMMHHNAIMHTIWRNQKGAMYVCIPEIRGIHFGSNDIIEVLHVLCNVLSSYDTTRPYIPK